MLKNFKPSFFILSIIFFAACSPLEYDGSIEPTLKNDPIKDPSLEMITLSLSDDVSEGGDISARDRRGCNCRVTFDASPNVQQANWRHTLAFTAQNGATGQAVSAGSPNLSLPFSVNIPFALMRNSPFTHELELDYDQSPLQEGGTFTFTFACHVAPPYVKTFNLPPVSKVGGGTLTFRGVGRITNECGTEGLQVVLE